MSSARRSLGAVVFAGFLVICVALWLLRGAIDLPSAPGASATAAATASASAAAASAVREAPATTTPPATPELPPPPEPAQLRGQDTVDPCTAAVDPAIPPGFDTVTADGVTVAWQPGVAAQGPYDVALAPVALAHLIAGLVTEAATLTGTPRRDKLTAIIYPSRASFREATRAPAWSDGVYDGGAIRVAAVPNAELGVEVTSLRHELIHAQLHTTVGCMPSWLNEGLAMYFAGAPPIRVWLRMLRNPDSFDLGSLEVPTLISLSDDRAERAYAESLAMVVYLVERSGELGVRTAVQTLRTARPDQSVWSRLYPGAGHRAVLDALSRKLFGVPLGADLEAILRGAVCCYGLRAVSEVGCRGVVPRTDRTRWFDTSSSPRAACDATW